MGFQGNLGSYGLGDLFQNISSNARTGTLRIIGPAGEKNIYFVEGQIRLLAHGARQRGMLQKVLNDSKLISREQVESAVQKAGETNVPVLNVVLEMGLIEEENLKSLVHFAIEEDIYDLFTWEEAQFDFVDGQPTAGVFEGELFADENAFNTNHLVMEAARRSDEWGRIRSVVTSDENVFVIINEARPNLEQFDKDSAPLKVVMFIDGYRSVGELVSAAGVGKFDMYEALFQLYQQGIVRHKTFEELFQTGIELKKKDQIKKAIVFLRRALTVQTNSECMRALGELYEANSEPRSAADTFRTLAQAYKDNGDDDSALEAHRKVIELNPPEAEAHNEIAKILAARDMTDDAVSEYINYSEKLLTNKQIQKSREICYRILNLKPQNYHAHRLLAKGYLWEGNSESAIAEYKSLAQAMLASMKPKDAVKEYARILDEECNFPAVKEGVKDFLLKSGEVKSYGLMRFLLTLIILVVMGAAGIGGYIFYKQKTLLESAQSDLGQLQADLKDKLAAHEHMEVLNRCGKILERYHMYAQIKTGVEEVRSATEGHLRKLIDDQLVDVERLYQTRRFNDALAKTGPLLEEYNKKGFGFLLDKTEEIRNWEKRIKTETEADLISAKYKEAAGCLDAGQWDKVIKLIREILLNVEPAPFSDTETAIITNYPDEVKLFTIKAGTKPDQDLKGDVNRLVAALPTREIAPPIKQQLILVLGLLAEVTAAEFDGKRMFLRYQAMKAGATDEDRLKVILERAKDLGSPEAPVELQSFDEMRAQTIRRDAQDNENKRDFEQALRAWRRIMETEKLKTTETAGMVTYPFVVQTDPDGVAVTINGQPAGMTAQRQVYRYRPGETVTVTLSAPTFKAVKFDVKPTKAVYPVKMEIGPERSFRAKAALNGECLLARDTLYFGDADGFLYALALQSFTNEWDDYDRGAIRFGSTGRPFEFRDTIFFGTERGDVNAMARNMARKWARQGGATGKSEIVGFAGCENPIKMAEYLLFAATRDGEIIALNALTGEDKWKVKIKDNLTFNSGIFVFRTTLYVGADDGNLYGMDIISYRDGLKSLGGACKSIVTEPTLIIQDPDHAVVLFGSKDKKVYACGLGRDVIAGFTKYDEFEAQDWIQSDLLVVGPRVYFGSDDHMLYCLDVDNTRKFRKAWSFRTSDKIQGSPAFMDGIVFAGCIDGKVFAVNGPPAGGTDTAREKWQFSTGGKIRGGLMTWGNHLLVPVQEGSILAFLVK
ncbi:MAG: PQQ-binding-like beta-propeller repeat protein [Planctomycetota bacterium]